MNCKNWVFKEEAEIFFRVGLFQNKSLDSFAYKGQLYFLLRNKCNFGLCVSINGHILKLEFLCNLLYFHTHGSYSSWLLLT